MQYTIVPKLVLFGGCLLVWVVLLLLLLLLLLLVLVFSIVDFFDELLDSVCNPSYIGHHLVVHFFYFIQVNWIDRIFPTVDDV